jgi:REP element-mobilizing transposase RayT
VAALHEETEMGHSYLRLYYHFVWGTFNRAEVITPDLEPRLYGYIRQRCEGMRVLVHALNGTEDHSHLACSLTATVSVAQFMQKVKGASSHFTNELPELKEHLDWQPGYGALTFSKRDLPRIVAYINNQKKHHREGTLISSLERFEEE